ncbi:hypothetical protein ASPWEDRAFT_28348 [Aspergillus wentii DTO 134E9]|uniref:Yippee domain-containing protein n=1 Tax=Aspergillus wentii DTO 134E9 TaxID=1073089 RepID=A0A1L9RLD1_ASPWE|nr:uncharacterized protein ASPWEDRAFT_28348 [Aspergillus wentii DTO 134E9]KAI9924503.1 hypothetical protein MW887_006775 [Aspergillus wentii]OJJ35732.1 hypothetical protein ASPWEDRAFT_28348 [Aspergillus wentii DTO 134E9]
MPKVLRLNFSAFPKFLLSPTEFHAKQDAGSISPRTTANHSTGKARTEKYLDGHVSYIRCSRCAIDLCLTSQIISKGFTGRHGRAYLVSPEATASAVSVSGSSSPTSSLQNTIIQKPVPRELVTGSHTVSDVCCAFCGSVLGWKYVAAEEESQRYKVGKFILETKRTTTTSCWDSASTISPKAAPALDQSSHGETGPSPLNGHVEFDSQDEDECEDLFAGIWSPDLATRRKNRKIDRRPAMFGLN